MNGNNTDAAVTLAVVLDDALSPLDSLSDILAAAGHEDVAIVLAGLLRDARSRLQSVARCLESGCGRPILLRDFGGVLCPVPCACAKDRSACLPVS